MASLLSISLLFLAISDSMLLCSSRKVDLKIKEHKLDSVFEPHSTSSGRFDPSKATQISWHPRVFLYEGFLSYKECDHLISLAHGKLEKSLVIDHSGNSTASSVRTSSGMFLDRGQDEIVSRIEERISAWTFLPRENGEDMQILHYGINESYQPHHDYFHDKTRLVFGGHRIATVLLYLSNVTRGGETIFPESELRDTQLKDDSWSDCTAAGYAVKPVKGNGLLFFSLNPNAAVDERSLHGGCKVLEGEKWSATKWIHVKAFDISKPSASTDGECTDEDDQCPHWAAIGECQRNSVYMLGTPDYYGSCRKSCGAC